VVIFPGASSLLRSTASNGNSPVVWAGIGAIAGVVFFVQGFRMLRFKRIILNTPASKVRSASMGLVEVTGMADGPATIPAGITGEACFYYRALASQVKGSGKNRHWQTVADERLFVPFFVEDGTGQMLVNPQGADMDLHSNFKDEIGSSFFSNRDMVPENISKFLARHGIDLSTEVRLQEWCVKPSEPLFVLGTLGERTSDPKWSALPHSSGAPLSLLMGYGLASRNQSKLVNSISFLPGVSLSLAPSVGQMNAPHAVQPQSPTPALAPTPAAAVWKSVSWEEGTQARVIMAAAAERKAAADATPSAPVADGVDASSQDDLQGAVAPQAAIGLASDPPAEAAVDAPQEQESRFRMACPGEIGKGASGQPFFISYRSQREVARSFAWKSALCIWGGPILTLVSLYFLSEYFNWL